MIWDTIAAIPLAQLTAFVAGGLMLNVAPGQDVFFASACGIQGGPRAGALAGLGVGLGVLPPIVIQDELAQGLLAIGASLPGIVEASDDGTYVAKLRGAGTSLASIQSVI